MAWTTHAASVLAIALASAGGAASLVADGGAGSRGADPAGRCAALTGAAAAGIDEAAFRPAGPVSAPAPGQSPAAPGSVLPAHCDLHGVLDQRTGVNGQRYAIRYHLRLPEQWNGRFFFQGGGGTNGVVGDALGQVGAGRPSALAQGYAVVSQDSGHDNRLNNDPARGGTAVFGEDPRARADYGGTSLKRVADTARSVVARFYGRAPQRSYFVGCSKGGQEGMALAQRYPGTFDGIVAAAPGFSLPRAALAQTWDVQTFGALATPAGARSFPFARLPATFTDAQLRLVRRSVLEACDADDGLKDGIVGRFAQCTFARVGPRLAAATCAGASGDACLAPAQVAALRRSLDGPHDAAGRPLYAAWPWDGGVGAEGWRLWKLGSARMPALNVLTGGPALAMMFSVPPTPIHADPQSYVDYETGFDVAGGSGTIDATGSGFTRSAWADIAARSPDLAAFRARGGKLIVPHGASDPVFSINDTLTWYEEVQQREGGNAARFVRVFPVPGMNHCGGGPATDQYDAFAALVDWVEHGRAPERIEATAGPASPWPGRTRPLCPYPKVATWRGSGSIEDSRNFTCS